MKFENTASGETARTLRLIRLAEVKRLTGMSRSTIYRWMSAGNFPQSYPLGGRMAAWSQTEIDNWILRTLDRAP
jgi:prophage regulatory protein